MESFYGTKKNNNKKNQYFSSVLDWKEGMRDLMGRYDCL